MYSSTINNKSKHLFTGYHDLNYAPAVHGFYWISTCSCGWVKMSTILGIAHYNSEKSATFWWDKHKQEYKSE